MHSPWLSALFAALWLVALAWHVHENRALKRHSSAAPFRALLVGRSVQCLFLLAVCFVLMAIVLMKPAAAPVALPPIAAITPPARPETVPAPAQQPEAHAIAPSQEGAQDTLDRIKERYEETLVNYFFLRQCNKAGDEEYRIIMGALQAQLQQRMAPASMVQNILLAAQGSYNEIYSRLPCDHKDVVSQEAQFRRYLEKLKAKR